MLHINISARSWNFLRLMLSVKRLRFLILLLLFTIKGTVNFKRKLFPKHDTPCFSKVKMLYKSNNMSSIVFVNEF